MRVSSIAMLSGGGGLGNGGVCFGDGKQLGFTMEVAEMRLGFGWIVGKRAR